MKVSKQNEIVIKRYMSTYVDYKKMKDTYPSEITTGYIEWLFKQWNSGLISLPEYRKLISINVLEV